MTGRAARWAREREWRQSLERAERDLLRLEREREDLDDEIAQLKGYIRSLTELLPKSSLRSDASAEIVSLRPAPGADLGDDEASPHAPDSEIDRPPWGERTPKLTEAIVQVLRELDEPASAKRVVQELTARGWMPENSTDPIRYVYMTLARMHTNRNMPISRVEMGVYVHTG